MSEPNAGIPQVKDNRPKIAGLLPKNAQARLLGGIALVMVLVILFSGRKPQGRSPERPPVAVTASLPNPERIQEYRARIEDESRQLAAEEAALANTKQPTPLGERAAPSFGQPTSLAGEDRRGQEKSWIELDREKREYQGLFAPSVALSYRRPTEASGQTLQAAAGPIAGSPVLTFSQGVQARPQAVSPTRPQAELAVTKPYHLMEGTILETVLTNRLDASFSGPVNCMVTANVYSRDGMTLLIPQGARVLGEVKKLESFGQQRVAVFFHRLLMPNGYSANLDQFQGLNQIGETGLRDQVNHHYLQIFGVSLAIGAIAGLAQANTRYGATESGLDAYDQGVTTSLSQTSMRILDRYLNVLPTFTIREGHRVKIYLSQDLALPAYDAQPDAERISGEAQ
jgi:type IV secretion system protein TrbI